MVSTHANDVSIFVLCCSDIEVVQKGLEWYKKVIGTKINCNQSSGLCLGTWKLLHFWDSLFGMTEQSTFLECGSDSASS